jgi:hypothetical protein
VTTAVMAWNDGGSSLGGINKAGSNSSDLFVVDNVMGGGTFFQFAGNARINPNLTAGFQVTMALCGGARSHQVNQNDDDAPQATCFVGGGADTRGGDSTMVLTLANWYLDHKSFGRLTVGRINTATAGITTIDLGGAGVIANASIGYTQRGFNLIDSDFDTLLGGTWSNALGGGTVNGASLSRANAVMYSTPTFGGFSLAISGGENDTWDAAARYAGEFGGFRFAAGIGFQHNSTGLNDVTADIPGQLGPQPDVWKGSASVMHVGSGLYLTGAFVHQDNDIAGRPDTQLYYVQGGISKNWTGLGNTVLYGEWARVHDGIICNTVAGTGSCANFSAVAGDSIFSSEATMWGLGVVQHIDAAAMELFLSFKRFSAEADAASGSFSYSDFDVVLGGARIRF